MARPRKKIIENSTYTELIFFIGACSTEPKLISFAGINKKDLPTVTNIAKRLDITQPAATQLANRLEQEGYVIRENSHTRGNRKYLKLYFSRLGIDLIEALNDEFSRILTPYEETKKKLDKKKGEKGRYALNLFCKRNKEVMSTKLLDISDYTDNKYLRFIMEDIINGLFFEIEHAVQMTFREIFLLFIKSVYFNGSFMSLFAEGNTDMETTHFIAFLRRCCYINRLNSGLGHYFSELFQRTMGELPLDDATLTKHAEFIKKELILQNLTQEIRINHYDDNPRQDDVDFYISKYEPLIDRKKRLKPCRFDFWYQSKLSRRLQ